VLDLYQRNMGRPGLGDDEYVPSSDEQPGLQVMSRVHPGLRPARAGKDGPSSSTGAAARWRTGCLSR